MFTKKWEGESKKRETHRAWPLNFLCVWLHEVGKKPAPHFWDCLCLLVPHSQCELVWCGGVNLPKVPKEGFFSLAGLPISNKFIRWFKILPTPLPSLPIFLFVIWAIMDMFPEVSQAILAAKQGGWELSQTRNPAGFFMLKPAPVFCFYPPPAIKTGHHP